MRLYFIRHGQSELNLKGVLAGQTDTPLTDEGRKQAKEAAVKLEGIKFDAVFSSDLSRAHETQKIMLPNHTAVTTPLLREYDLGILVGKSTAECREIYGERLTNSFVTHDYRFFDGECIEDVKLRIGELLKDILNKDYENVAVFCHAGVCKTMLSVAFGNNAFSTYCDNCAINVFEYVNGVYKLVKWNY